MNQTQQSREVMRRSMYRRDKILATISPFGPSLRASLREMIAIAEKHERRDGIEDARELLARIDSALKEQRLL